MCVFVVAYVWKIKVWHASEHPSYVYEGECISSWNEVAVAAAVHTYMHTYVHTYMLIRVVHEIYS